MLWGLSRPRGAGRLRHRQATRARRGSTAEAAKRAEAAGAAEAQGAAGRQTQGARTHQPLGCKTGVQAYNYRYTTTDGTCPQEYSPSMFTRAQFVPRDISLVHQPRGDQRHSIDGSPHFLHGHGHGLMHCTGNAPAAGAAGAWTASSLSTERASFFRVAFSRWDQPAARALSFCWHPLSL